MGYRESQSAAANLFRVTRNLQARLQQIQAYQNKDLTPQALIDWKDRARGTVIAAAQEKARAYVKTATDGRDFARSRVIDLRPRVDPNNVAQLTVSAQTWDLVIKPLRERGRSWFEIAEHADWVTLQALTRFAEQIIRTEETPTQIEIMRGNGPAPSNVEQILSNLQRTIDARVAQIHPDEEARQLFQEAEKAEGAAHAVEVMAAHLGGVRDATTTVPGLIAGKSLLYELDIFPKEAPLTAEQQDRVLEVLHANGPRYASAVAGFGEDQDAAYTVLPAA